MSTNHADFKVKHGLVVNTTASFLSTVTSVSTTTGGVILSGGAGIAKDVVIGGSLNVGPVGNGVITSQGDISLTSNGGSVIVTTSTNATNTTTGALQVVGGVGIQGDLYARNLYSNGQQVGLQSNTTTNLAGGLQYQIPYQSGPGSTTFIIPPPTTQNSLLQFTTGTGFTWTNTTTVGGGTFFYSPIVDTFTSNGTTTTFALSVTPASKNLLTVVIDGVTQLQTAFSLSGNNLVFSEIPYNGAVIDVHYSQVLSTTTSPAAGFPGQIQYNWNGMISGTTFMSYNSATGVVSITATTAATSTQTGALTVTGGMGIGGDLYVGGDIVANRLTIQLTTVTTTLVTTDDIISTYNTTPTNSTNTGALQIGGGIGVAGGGYFGGVITATNVFVNGYAVSTASALTIQGSGVGLGTAGTLNFATGTIATVANSLATIWLNTATLMSNAVTAINLAGGAFGSIPVQSGSGTTSFIAAGTQGQMFVHGVGQGYWENTSSIYVANASVATNIRAGTAGQLVYQSAANTTGFINTATTGNFLQANYAGAPTWTSTSSMYVYRATVADSASGTAGSVANALSTGTGLLFNAGTTYDGSAARTISLNTTTLVATAVTAFTANKVANALSAGTGLTGTAFDGSAAVTWTLNTATLMQVATQVVQSHSTGTGILGSSYNGSTAQTWTLDTSTLMARAVQTVQSLTAGTGLTGTAFNGSTAQTWTLNTATLMQTAVNLAGGSAGQFAYQTAANTTAFMSTGSMYVYRATIADSASGSSAQVNTQAQTANATYFPTFVDSNNSGATGETVYTTSSFILNPATGQVGLGYISTSSRLTVNGRIESMTDPASEGGQVILRGKNWYRWSIDNYQDTFRIIREDDVTEANGQSALIISSGTNSAVMLGTTTPYSGERLAVNGGVYVNGIATATTFVGALTGTASNATTATAAATAYSTIGTLTAGTGLSGTAFNGSANQTWTLNTATLMANAVTAINLAGGSAGQFAYQTGAGATSFVSTSNMYVARAAYVDTVAQVTNATYYPAFVDSNNATAGWEPVYTTSSFSVNAATGVVSGNMFAATNNGNGTNFKVGDDAWIGDVNTADTFRVTGQQNAANGYIIFGNNDTTALGRAGSGSLTYGGNVIVHGGNTSTTYVGRAVLADSVTGSAGSLVNAVTFNNAGSGDASGTTYNGGSARTISYNTLGAMPTTGGTFSGPVTFSGAVTFSGTATYVLSTQTFYTDNILNLHVPPSGVNGQWTQDDGKDVGFKFHYYTNSTDTNAALVLANDTKWLEWYSSGAEGTSTFAGSTYGNFKTGGIWATSGAGVGYTSSQIGEKFGVNGGGYFNGIVTATTFVGALTGTASNATNATTATSAGTAYSTIGTHTAGTGLSGTAFNGSANQTWTLNTATLMQTAVNLASGSAGQLHYQTAANTSGFINTATTGNFLQANYVGAPTWTSTGSMYVGRAVIADSVSGSAGSLVNALSTGSGLLFNAGTTYDGSAARTISLNTSTYMALAANATSANKVANALSAGTGLTGTAFDGSAAQTWTLNTATLMQTSVSAINLSAGSAMALPYQSASGTTAYLSAGTSGYILQTNGTGSAPTWVAASGLSAGSSTNADNLKTIMQTASGTYYPSFVDSNNSTAAYEAHYTTSSFVINPATGAVGIGFSSPSAKLHIAAVADGDSVFKINGQGGTNATVKFADVDIGGQGYGGAYLSWGRGGSYDNWFMVYTRTSGNTSAERLRITANGGVAFGGASNYGSSGQILQSNGDAAPTWVSLSGLSAGTATNADNLKTVQQTASASYYPSFVDSNNSTAAYEAHYTTSSFYLNPASGLVTIAAPAGGDSLPSFRVTQGTAPNSFNWIAGLINSSLGSSRNLIMNIGQAESNKNCGYIGFNHNGTSGSVNNFLTFGLHSVDNIMNITGNGYVGIGNTAPGFKLSVNTAADVWHAQFGTSGGKQLRIGGSTTAGSVIGAYNDDGNSSPATLLLQRDGGSVGIGVSSTSGKLHVAGAGNSTGGNIHLGDNTDAAAKWTYITAAHYNGATNATGVSLIGHYASSTANQINIGGNIYEAHPATEILFYTHTATTHATGGSLRLTITRNGGFAFGTSASNYGSSGQILQSNGDAAPTWVNASTIAAGSAPLTNTYVGFGSASNLLTGSANLTWDGTILSILGASSNGYIKFASNTGTKLRFYDASTDKYGIDVQSSELRIYSGAQGTSTGGTTIGKYDGTTFTEYFRFTNSGGFAVGGSSNYGSSGQVLQSNGNAAPTWVNPSGLTVSASTTALRIVFNDGPRDLSDRLPNSYTRTVNWDFVGAGTAGTSGNYAGVMTFAPWTGTTASTGDGSYQLAFGNASGTNASGQPTLRIRTGIDSTWNSWYTLLHAGNVSSYTAGGISNFTAATSSNPMDASSPPTIDAIGYVSSNIPSSYGLGGSVGSQSDGGLYVAGYSTSWYHEIYGDFRTGGLAVRGKYSGTWQSWRNIPCISVQDTAPSIYNPGDLWWESDTGRLKVLYYDGSSSQWVDVVPVVDTSLFFSKAGGAISGPVSINGTLDVTGNITATAEITAYYSDRRLKTDIVTIENALVKVKKLNGVTYRPNELAKSYGLDTNSDVVGLFADEVEAVLPQAVKPAPFDIDENGNSKSGENYKTIQYEKVVPLLVEAIKDQQKIIEEQQAKIDRLMKHLGLE